MIKQGKFLVIGLSSIVAVGMGTKLVSFPDEKLSTSSLSKPDIKAPAVNPEAKDQNAAPTTKSTTLLTDNHAIKNPNKRVLVEKIIKNGLSLIGTPYRFGGTTEKGFDCSGFVQYAFKKFNITVPRSSTELAEAGKKVKLHETRKGDILVFTGTNVSDRTPGHVGIVISKTEDVIHFVHSSSNGGVKISQVQGTNYERRFLETRRVL